MTTIENCEIFLSTFRSQKDGGGLNKRGGGGGEGFGGRNKRGFGFLLFLRPKFGYLLQNRPANEFYELLKGKILENKKTKFSHAKQILFTFFRNTNEYEY